MPPKRKFRDAWLIDEKFADWLTKVEDNPDKAQCRNCNLEIAADITSLKRHKLSKLHTLSTLKVSDNNWPPPSSYTDKDLVLSNLTRSDSSWTPPASYMEQNLVVKSEPSWPQASYSDEERATNCRDSSSQSLKLAEGIGIKPEVDWSQASNQNEEFTDSEAETNYSQTSKKEGLIINNEVTKVKTSWSQASRINEKNVIDNAETCLPLPRMDGVTVKTEGEWPQASHSNNVVVSKSKANWSEANNTHNNWLKLSKMNGSVTVKTEADWHQASHADENTDINMEGDCSQASKTNDRTVIKTEAGCPQTSVSEDMVSKVNANWPHSSNSKVIVTKTKMKPLQVSKMNGVPIKSEANWPTAQNTDEGLVTEANAKWPQVQKMNEERVIKAEVSSPQDTKMIEDTIPNAEANSLQATNVYLDLVTKAEIKLTTFVVDHNLSFNATSDLFDLLQDIFADSLIAKNMTLQRSEVASASVLGIGNVFGRNFVFERLKKLKFSLITYETTDENSCRSCALVARYYDPSTSGIESKVVELFRVYDSRDTVDEDAVEEHLFHAIMKLFQYHGIPKSNLIGFAADGDSNIMEEDQVSLISRLRNEVPGITVVKCASQSAHECIYEGVKIFLKEGEDLIVNIFTYFSQSAKMKRDFKDFQKFCDVEPSKLLYAYKTNLLSFQGALKDILEHWHPLTTYFINHHSRREGEQLTDTILHGLRDPSVLLYLKFLDFVLSQFSYLNLLLQKRSASIHTLHRKSREVYLDFLRCFCQRTAINGAEDITQIDFENEENFVNLNEIYLGVDVYRSLRSSTFLEKTEMVDQVKKSCRHFLIMTCNEIKNRYPLNSKTLEMCSIFSIRAFVDEESRIRYPSLVDLASHFPRIFTGNYQDLDNEWRSIENIYIPKHIKELRHSELFFKELLSLRNEAGEAYFKVLPQFALDILALPTSDADAKRILIKDVTEEN